MQKQHEIARVPEPANRFDQIVEVAEISLAEARLLEAVRSGKPLPTAYQAAEEIREIVGPPGEMTQEEIEHEAADFGQALAAIRRRTLAALGVVA